MCGIWWNGGWGWGPWGSTLGIVGLILNLLLFLALLGLGIAWLVRRLGHAPAGSAGPDPLEIARRRLAAGKITAAEFEEIRSRLRS